MALGQHTRLFQHSPLVGVSSCSVLAAGQQKHSLPVTPDPSVAVLVTARVDAVGQAKTAAALVAGTRGALHIPLLEDQNVGSVLQYWRSKVRRVGRGS
jgi:hypothetical protein